MVEFSIRAAKSAGVLDQVKFVKADLFETDFSEATVITMYLLSSLNLKLRPKILGLKPGTRVVSHAFDMADWKPDRTELVDGKTAYLWIVPARVNGIWQLPQGELTLRQEFQKVEGTLKVGDRLSPVIGTLNGDQLRFVSSGADYTGRVSDNRIDGTVTGTVTGNWNASRRSFDPGVPAKK